MSDNSKTTIWHDAVKRILIKEMRYHSYHVWDVYVNSSSDCMCSIAVESHKKLEDVLQIKYEIETLGKLLFDAKVYIKFYFRQEISENTSTKAPARHINVGQ